jgi:hypothetical protein
MNVPEEEFRALEAWANTLCAAWHRNPFEANPAPPTNEGGGRHFATYSSDSYQGDCQMLLFVASLALDRFERLDLLSE